MLSAATDGVVFFTVSMQEVLCTGPAIARLRYQGSMGSSPPPARMSAEAERGPLVQAAGLELVDRYAAEPGREVIGLLPAGEKNLVRG